MGYVGIFFDLEGQQVTREPITLSTHRSVAVSQTCNAINGRILRVARHWVLVGDEKQRVLVCKNLN